MIIDNTYFTGDLYLAQAKPGLVPENSLSSKFVGYIEEHSSDCLLKCLGYILFEEFASQLDISKDNGLIDDADEKWNELLNGKSYEKDGKAVKWRGIRFKQIGSTNYQSFITNYVHFHYLSETQTTSTPTGEKKVNSKNTAEADVSRALARNWNKFVSQCQPFSSAPIVIERSIGFGLDYYTARKNQYLTLSEFITDMNTVDSDTYKDYSPEIFRRINSMGI